MQWLRAMQAQPRCRLVQERSQMLAALINLSICMRMRFLNYQGYSVR